MKLLKTLCFQARFLKFPGETTPTTLLNESDINVPSAVDPRGENFISPAYKRLLIERFMSMGYLQTFVPHPRSINHRDIKLQSAHTLLNLLLQLWDRKVTVPRLDVPHFMIDRIQDIKQLTSQQSPLDATRLKKLQDGLPCKERFFSPSDNDEDNMRTLSVDACWSQSQVVVRLS